MESFNSIECNDRFISNSKSNFNNNIYCYRGCIGMYINSTNNGDDQSNSCTYCFTKHYNLYRTEYHFNSQRSKYVFLESFNSIKCYNRFIGHCQSIIYYNVYGDRRCIGMHSDCTSNGDDCEPTSHQRFTANNMCRTKHEPYSKRSEHVHLEPFSIIECINRFISYSKSKC